MAVRALASLLAVALAIGCAQTPAPQAATDAALGAEIGAGDTAPALDGLASDGGSSADGAGVEMVQPQDGGPEIAADAAPGSDGLAEAIDDAAVDTAAFPDVGEDASAGADGDGEPDVAIGPPKPEAAVLGPPVAVTEQLLFKAPVAFAAATHGAQVLAQAGTLTMIASEPDLPPVLLGGTPGTAHAVAAFAPDQLLVASAAGIFAVVKSKLLTSPLQSVVGAPPLALFVQPGATKPWLWVVANSGVWRHDGAVAQALQIQGQDPASIANALWRAGPQVAIDPDTGKPKAGGKLTPAVWLYLQGGVYALVVSGSTGKLWLDESIAQGLDLRCDGAGNVWVRAADGTVHRRSPDGAWQWLALPEAVTAVVARADWPVAALQTASGLWVHQDGVFFAASATASWQLRDLTATGAMVVSGPKGLARLVPGEVKPPPPPSWAATVEPIFKARCANCHGPTAVTVKLNTAAFWKQWYPKVLIQLDTDAMPLLPPKLSAQEKAMVKAWGNGGFAP